MIIIILLDSSSQASLPALAYYRSRTEEPRTIRFLDDNIPILFSAEARQNFSFLNKRRVGKREKRKEKGEKRKGDTDYQYAWNSHPQSLIPSP